MSEALLEGERSWGRTYLVRQGQAGGSVRVHHIGEGSSDINPDELLGLLVGGAGPNVYARRRAPSLHRKARPVRERESNPGRNPTAPEGVPLLGDAPGRPVGRDNLNPRHGLGGAANAAPHLHRALGFRSSASSANTGADLCSKVFATSVSSSCPALTWHYLPCPALHCPVLCFQFLPCPVCRGLAWPCPGLALSWHVLS